MPPPSPEVVRFLKAVSSTLAWSLSFYPQPILNYRRRSTQGTTPAFPTLNVLGFLAYSISTAAFYGSPLIRAQYAARNPLSPEGTVRFNDLAFAIHGLILCVVTLSMFSQKLWDFKQGQERVGRCIWGITVGCVVGMLWVVGVVLGKGKDWGRDPLGWAWIDVIYALGFCKLVTTIVKYIPQAYVNYQSQSTDGWSIGQILLDLGGGILSNLQLVIDSSLQDDWSGITGNPIKLGLGNITIIFDIVFMCQHYILYRHKKTRDDGLEGERRSLLASDGETLAR
ncbi:MAG: hypothetical protein HETSPECPRED_004663 [Heterodermia speciosa]|uniref:Cystinosin n=1 Tax=Heterodermia speciosa TaxID=116794 RepID=A0A8H3FE52_9LECA|nr:MAG: hypothetical protein HETSPECPRED_004663 [Heterodermia speciosa]